MKILTLLFLATAPNLIMIGMRTQVFSEVYQLMSLSLQGVLLAEHSRTGIPEALAIVTYYPLCSVFC